MPKKKKKLWFAHTWVYTSVYAHDMEEARELGKKEILDMIENGDFSVVVQKE